MTMALSALTDEEQIRKLIEEMAAAVRVKSVDGCVVNNAPDVVLFAFGNPLQNVGIDAARARVEEFLSMLQGPVEYDVRDLTIAVGGDVAFCHSLNHVSAATADGGTLDMWWRSTVGCRKIDGKWKITHEHLSVPFDPETGKASLNLQPSPTW